ncbi:nucleotidyltransferase domain-containing protein [Candidatus Gottesmanbacteria bacterium]|nr:nucleotidyltransferase domain-containing protein [Candidatus Gottesmanbacteria bacterium]
MLKTLQKNKIRKFAKTRPIELIYLYGSQATNQSDLLSDYDFGILFNKSLASKNRFDLRLKLFTDIAKIINVSSDNIDVVDLAEVPLLLQFNIISGRLLYERNQESKVAFETFVMSRYHDNHHLYDKYLVDTLTKIREGVYFGRQISHS